MLVDFLDVARFQPVLQLAVHLVLEDQPVNQACIQRGFSDERAVIDKGAHVRHLLLASLRDHVQ